MSFQNKEPDPPAETAAPSAAQAAGALAPGRAPAATGAWVQLLGHRSTAVTHLCIDPEGGSILAAHRDGLLRVLDPMQGTELHAHDCGSAILALSWSPTGPQGAWAAVGTEHGDILRFDLASRTAARLAAPTGRRLTCLAHDATGQRLAAARGIAIELFDAPAMAPQGTFNGHTDRVTGLAFSHDGQWLVSGSLDGTVRVWHLAEQRVVHIHRAAGKVDAVALSADGQWLAFGTADGAVTVAQWQPDGSGRQRMLAAGGGPVVSLGFSADSRWLAIGKQGTRHGLATASTLGLWDTHHGALHREVPLHDTVLTAVACAPSGDWVACGGQGGEVVLVARTTTAPRHALRRPELPVSRLALSPDAAWLASGHADGTLAFWQPGTGQELGRKRAHLLAVQALALTAQGRWVASGAADGSLVVSGQRRTHALRAPRGLQSLALSPDDRWLALGTVTGHGLYLLNLRELPKAQPVLQQTFAATLTTLAFSPDGRHLAGATRRGLLLLWEVNRGGLGARREMPALGDATLAFSSDGRWLASGVHGGPQGGGVCLWDLNAQAEHTRLRGPRTALHHAAFTPDARTLAAVDDHGQTWVWAVPSGDLLAVHNAPPYRHACLGLAWVAGATAAAPLGDDTLALRRLDASTRLR